MSTDGFFLAAGSVIVSEKYAAGLEILCPGGAFIELGP
jgi:hypothetical protein